MNQQRETDAPHTTEALVWNHIDSLFIIHSLTCKACRTEMKYTGDGDIMVEVIFRLVWNLHCFPNLSKFLSSKYAQ